MHTAKKVLFGLVAPAVVGIASMATPLVAHAQSNNGSSAPQGANGSNTTPSADSNFFSPVNQWIILDNLYNSGTHGGTANNSPSPSSSRSAGSGSPMNNPVSQWVVIDDLFGNGSGTSNTATTTDTSGRSGKTSGSSATSNSNPISQWIVLQGLFHNDSTGH